MANNYDGDLRELVNGDVGALPPGRPIFIFCPNHDDVGTPNLAVYYDHAYCYACRLYISRRQFLTGFSSEELTAAKMQSVGRGRPSMRPKANPGVLALAAAEMLRAKPHALDYLYSRLLSDATIQEYMLGHYGAGYTLPVFDTDGGVVNVRFRRDDSIKSDMGKYWGLRGFNDVQLYPVHGPVPFKRIAITEGELDALLLRQSGIAAYSFTNGANAKLSDELLAELFANVEELEMVRDQDTPGRAGTAALIDQLHRACPHIHVLDNVWMEEYGKDVGEIAVNAERPDVYRSLIYGLTRFGTTLNQLEPIAV